ncbi:hypothetical protein SAMN05518670_6292 [Paenibacillus sp. OK076]|nr:hypothetical protein SAMN05518670_6292 [Paenibacillus sp. OK076]
MVFFCEDSEDKIRITGQSYQWMIFFDLALPKMRDKVARSPFERQELFIEKLAEIPSCQRTTYSYILMSQVAGMVKLHDIKEMKHEWRLA